MARRALLIGGLTLVACERGQNVPSVLGELCRDVGEATCALAAECNQGFDALACETDYVFGCCGDGDRCDEPIAVADWTRADYNACLGDLRWQSCAMLGSGELPARCEGLFDPPS